MLMPLVNGAVRTVSKDSERELKELEIGGRAETIQTTSLFRSARIPRRVQKS